MLFFSNFNGSWDQYVDSFTFAIPSGLDMFWKWNLRYPRSVPLSPFHEYIQYNQIETSHYYNAYPLAASNDIKSAKVVKNALIAFNQEYANAAPEIFIKQYYALLRSVQKDLGDMSPSPIVSMAAAEVEKRCAGDAYHAKVARDLLEVIAHKARQSEIAKKKELADG